MARCVEHDVLDALGNGEPDNLPCVVGRGAGYPGVCSRCVHQVGGQSGRAQRRHLGSMPAAERGEVEAAISWILRIRSKQECARLLTRARAKTKTMFLRLNLVRARRGP
eukprot:2109612-Prymnesium_polylepis.1